MDVHFALVGSGGMMGIAQGDLHLPDNIAEIGHEILWISGPTAGVLKETPGLA